MSQALRAQMGERRLVSLEAFGLETALRELVDKISGQVKPDAVAIELEVKAGARANGHVEVAAYRIARQALANALEHAGGSQISVRLHEEAQAVSLVVADDGEGLRPAEIEEALRQGHLGLLEMRDRAAAVGGSLEIVSLGAKGTEVRFRWQA